MQPRANPYLGRILWSDLLNRLPAPAALGPRGRRAMVSVMLAAGVGVTGSTAVATSATSATPAGQAAAKSGQAAAKSGAAVLSAAEVEAQIEAEIAAETSLEPPAPVPGYVAAGNAAVGVPGAAPQMSLTRVLRKERPKPKSKPRPRTLAERAAVTSVVLPSISVERFVNPLPEAHVTSCFGMRWGRPHEGVDLAAPNRTPIRAAGAGEVVAAGPEQGYGNAVLIDHHDGYLTHYAHLSVISVQVGQEVAAGQQIGLEGSTGHSTGPHLHFEVHFGFYKNPIEPTAWLRERGIAISGCEAPARNSKVN